MKQRIEPSRGLRGTLTIPGDKSISHRSIMFGSLAEGDTEITGFLYGDDCLSTVGAFRSMGIDIDVTDEKIVVHGKGLHGLTEPDNYIDVGNSGTTIRLISGILAGQAFNTVLTGDDTIRKRPMGRVMKPLSAMGAKITGRKNNTLAPLAIEGTSLQAIHYDSPVASAQVKSAVLLAGLYADGWTSVTEPSLSRNHTELMLKSFGAEIESEGNTARVKGNPHLKGQIIEVPGDISSAAYPLVAGSIIPGSELHLKNVGLNPTRTGIIDVLLDMGADITISNERISGGEKMGDLTVRSAKLRGTTIAGDLIPRLVDEIPVIAVAAACAEGVTEIHDAQELKVKESNRLETVAQGLRAFGCDVEVLDDGLRISGGKPLQAGAECNSFGDHRIAMSMTIAALAAEGTAEIEQFEAVSVSWPSFWDDMRGLEVK
ncbi:MAG: 3-phosphoshikimate 1-carboxyvinyltransferase [Peptococcaceae bacterium]|nr:3-phosphoshikimate 1-carboxyvinyltransferase [Peptococcaceae bacterium]